MPSQKSHEDQVRQNQKVLASLPVNALDWQITLMFYSVIHGCRALISSQNPGYAGELNYESIPRVLQRELRQPFPEIASAFIGMKSICHAARYGCKDESWLKSKLPGVKAAYADILTRLRQAGMDVSLPTPPN